MIVFRDVEINAPFRYLWLKYVTGVNLNVHCAGCLKGEYSTKINIDLYREKQILLHEHPSRILYMCGVARPYKWENNFHLAMREAEGESFNVDEHGVTMTVMNAIPLPIDSIAVEAIAHPKRLDPKFHTCRNWRFANFLKLTGLTDPQQ